MSNDPDGTNPPPHDAPPQPTSPALEPLRSSEPASSENDTVAYDGEAGKLFGMGLGIAILSLITLGFYRFWGKTRIRRYLWSRVSLMKDRFEYTGTGKELFLGFLIALTVLIPLGAASYAIEFFLAGKSVFMYSAATIAQYAVIMFLIGYATFRARRYRLSRTVLRGIRFWQTGSSAGYALRWMGYLALTVITLGIARPVGDAALYRYMMGHTWFGSRNFEADGSAGAMMGRWILCLVLMPFTLGLSLLWYSAFRIRYLTSWTRYQGLALSLPVTFGNLFRIYLPYILVMLALLAIYFGTILGATLPMIFQGASMDPETLMSGNFVWVSVASTVAAIVVFGLISPVLSLVLLTHRMMRLIAERLAFEGRVDLDAVMQVAAEQPKRGEGLADALDIGGGLEVGL